MRVLKVCNIFCTEEIDFEMLKTYLKDFPVYLSQEDSVLEEDVPSIIVGWNYIKEKYPDQNIYDKKIADTNLSWTFSHNEEKESFLEDIKLFVNTEIKRWLPKDFIIYDPFFNGGPKAFIDKYIDFDNPTFTYYHKGALYVSNNDNNYSFNMNSLLYADERYGEQIIDFLNERNVVVFSYSNVDELVDCNKLKNPSFDSIIWAKFGVEIDDEKQFNIIPNFNYQKYAPFFMSFMGIPDLDKEDRKFAERMVKRDKVTRYCSTRKIAISKTLKIPGKKVIESDDCNFVNVNFSNKRTLTNRVVCKDKWNVQNEPKDSPRRKEMVSRFKGGQLLVCDYQSFETWISIYLTKNENFINYFKGKDVHAEVGRSLYGKRELASEERKFAKILNHSMLYGASYNKLVAMIGEKDIQEPQEKLYYVQRLLRPIVENSKLINEEVKKKGYSVTSWGSIVKPDKSYAAYNNLVQTTASEMLIDKIETIRNCLSNKRSDFVFQVHDSLIFDISPQDKGVIPEILNILSIFGKRNFPITYKTGSNYAELSEELVFSE